MRRVPLGRTGYDAPAIGFGTWPHGGPNEVRGNPVGWSGHDDEDALAALRESVDRGIDHWDTADVYGNGRSETLIGSLWGEVPRERVFLASKVGYDRGPHAHFYHPEWMRSQLERSLRLLRTDHLDLYYLHHCMFGDGDERLDDAVAAMRRFQEEGKIRFIGLSDWSQEAILRCAPRVQPDVVQPYRNVVDDAWQSSGLAAYTAEHQIGVAFFSPLRHGLLLGKYEAPADFAAGDFRATVDAFRDPDALARMRRAAAAFRERFAEHPEPVLHAVLGALFSDAPHGTALVGLRSPAQIAAAAAAGEAVSASDAAWIRAQLCG